MTLSSRVLFGVLRVIRRLAVRLDNWSYRLTRSSLDRLERAHNV